MPSHAGRSTSDAQLTVDQSLYIGSYCSISLWCLYTVLYFGAVYLLVRRSGGVMKMSRRTKILTAVCTVQWCLSTVYVAGELSLLTTGGDMSLLRAQTQLEVINCLYADSLLVWRAWVVWNRNVWILSFLIFLLLSTTAASVVMVVEGGVLNLDGSGSYLISTAYYYSSIVWGLCTLATNMVATGLIIGRVLYHKRRLERFGLSSTTVAAYRSVIILVADSGVLYSASLIATIVPLALKNPAAFLIFDILAQLTGIVPTSVIALVAFGVTNPDDDDNTTRNAAPGQSHDTWATLSDPSPSSLDQPRRTQIVLPLETYPSSTASLQPVKKESEQGS